MPTSLSEGPRYRVRPRAIRLRRLFRESPRGLQPLARGKELPGRSGLLLIAQSFEWRVLLLPGPFSRQPPERNPTARKIPPHLRRPTHLSVSRPPRSNRLQRLKQRVTARLLERTSSAGHFSDRGCVHPRSTANLMAAETSGPDIRGVTAILFAARVWSFGGFQRPAASITQQRNTRTLIRARFFGLLAFRPRQVGMGGRQTTQGAKS